jgi:hypothetical protein
LEDLGGFLRHRCTGCLQRRVVVIRKPSPKRQADSHCCPICT